VPELPEVESIRRYLQRLEGDRVSDVEASDEMIFADDLSPESIPALLEGKRVEKLDRRGKYLLIEFEHGWLIYSLRMTGKAMLVEDRPVEVSYVKLKCDFESRPESLYLTSVRRLSRIYWYEGPDVTEQENLARLGPDPLSEGWDRATLEECFEGRRGPIKTILMDQGFVAGVGNIYANEVCFLTEIDPRRPADEITAEERARLSETLPELLESAAEQGGSSFTNFVGGDGEPGSFHLEHQVYDCEGDACPRCGQSIRRIELSNRSTFFCPDCQT
jgi:formamidopyrimidine-DNA glycosylase